MPTDLFVPPGCNLPHVRRSFPWQILRRSREPTGARLRHASERATVVPRKPRETDMRSHAVVEFGTPLKEIETPTPEPKGTEVLLEIRNAGVCHSDVHIH